MDYGDNFEEYDEDDEYGVYDPNFDRSRNNAEYEEGADYYNEYNQDEEVGLDDYGTAEGEYFDSNFSNRFYGLKGNEPNEKEGQFNEENEEVNNLINEIIQKESATNLQLGYRDKERATFNTGSIVDLLTNTNPINSKTQQRAIRTTMTPMQSVFVKIQSLYNKYGDKLRLGKEFIVNIQRVLERIPNIKYRNPEALFFAFYLVSQDTGDKKSLATKDVDLVSSISKKYNVDEFVLIRYFRFLLKFT